MEANQATETRHTGVVSVAQSASPVQPPKGATSKTDKVLKLLSRSKGVTSIELMKTTGWQAHSVRGFLSGTVRKRMGLVLMTNKDAKGTTRYRLASAGEQ